VLVVPRWCSPWLRGLALPLAVLVGWPAVAFASSPPVRLEVEARVGLPPEEQPSFEDAVAEAARKGAAQAEVATRADADLRLVIDVAWKDERRIDYGGRIEVRAASEPAVPPLAVRSFACEMCGATDLMVRIEQEVALALRGVTWPAPAPASEQAAAAMGPTDAQADDDRRTKREAPSLRRMGWAGVGIASTGLVAVTVGAVLWTRDDRLVLRLDDPDGPVWTRSLRPPGIGLVAGGAAAVVIGGALMAVDLVRGRERSDRVALRPAIERSFTGLRVEGRF
jgi:hypothetical protein